MGLSYHFVLPPTGPADAHVVREMFDDVKTYLDTFVPSGGAAPINAQYVTLATDATLTNERILTGTSNQVVITDNGAGSTVVLSLPQSIAITSSPSFASIVYRAASASKVTIKPQDPTPFADYILTLPDSDGGSGEVMKSDGNGVLSWTSIVSNISGTASQVLVSATTGSVTLSLPQNIDTSSSPTFNELLLSGGTSSADLTLKLHDSHTGFYADGLGGLTVVAGNGSNIIVGGWLSSDQSYNSVGPVKAPAFHFVDAGIGSPTVTILPPTGFTSYSLTLPVDDGTSNQILTTNGSGVLSWTTQTGSGTVNTGTTNRLAYYAASTAAVSALSAITASCALVSDSNGLPVASATTAVELGYVSGVSSAIQTQITAKATDSLVVHLAGSEAITGAKTFTNGQTAFADGTVSAPGVTFKDDLNNGLYRIGTDNWALAAGGVKVIELDASQRVGIGVAPLAGFNLNVQTVSSNYGINIVGPSSKYLRFGAGDPEVGGSGAEMVLQTISDDNIRLRINNGGTPVTGILINKTSGAVDIRGTNTNNSASAGFIGEYVESRSTSTTTLTTQNIYQDYLNITLTAGDWDISGMLIIRPNSSTSTEWDLFIGATSGNVSTDLVYGHNAVFTTHAVNIPQTWSAVIASYRVSIASTTTYYLKGFGSFSVGNPLIYAGRISARRKR